MRLHQCQESKDTVEVNCLVGVLHSTYDLV